MGSIVQGFPQLSEAVVEVTDFEGDYEGKLWRVREEVMGINRTDEHRWMATARAYVVVSDRSVSKIGYEKFHGCSNLVKVTAPFVEVVGEYAFWGSHNLHHVRLSSGVVAIPRTFQFCLSLEVPAVSVGFELDIGVKGWIGKRDPTVSITRFSK